MGATLALVVVVEAWGAAQMEPEIITSRHGGDKLLHDGYGYIYYRFDTRKG